MAAINFPNSPTDGQTYTANGRSWAWSSSTGAWLATTTEPSGNYTPAISANWDAGADPGDVNDALDQLASRTKDLEVALPDPYWVEVVLTAAGANIATGTKVAMMTHMQAGTITEFKTVCDPAAEPSVAAIEVDMNSVDLSTGAVTSRLSTVASIALSANTSTGGALSGTQTVAVGDQSSFDIDQGSDGKELRALIQITPS